MCSQQNSWRHVGLVNVPLRRRSFIETNKKRKKKHRKSFGHRPNELCELCAVEKFVLMPNQANGDIVDGTGVGRTSETNQTSASNEKKMLDNSRYATTHNHIIVYYCYYCYHHHRQTQSTRVHTHRGTDEMKMIVDEVRRALSGLWLRLCVGRFWHRNFHIHAHKHAHTIFSLIFHRFELWNCRRRLDSLNLHRKI